jgi:hypothetical protein
MSKTYVKPNMAKYGACQTLIQGSCGWGVENVTLDKTGYRKKKWRVKSTTAAMPCPGPDPNGNVNCSKPVTTCKTQKVCGHKNEC